MTQVVTRLALMVWLVLPFVADVQAADISLPSSDVFQGLVNEAHGGRQSKRRAESHCGIVAATAGADGLLCVVASA